MRLPACRPQSDQAATGSMPPLKFGPTDWQAQTEATDGLNFSAAGAGSRCPNSCVTHHRSPTYDHGSSRTRSITSDVATVIYDVLVVENSPECRGQLLTWPRLWRAPIRIPAHEGLAF